VNEKRRDAEAPRRSFQSLPTEKFLAEVHIFMESFTHM